MKQDKQTLIIEQLDRKLVALKPLENLSVPSYGWIYSIRTALKMSLRQLGNKLHISAQSVKELEMRESNGSITLRSLRDLGNAMDMQLVYGFVPKQESIEAMIEKRALELASEIVLRTSNTMKLEDQENSAERLQKAIKSKANEIREKMPKYLWD